MDGTAHGHAAPVGQPKHHTLVRLRIGQESVVRVDAQRTDQEVGAEASLANHGLLGLYLVAQQLHVVVTQLHTHRGNRHAEAIAPASQGNLVLDMRQDLAVAGQAEDRIHLRRHHRSSNDALQVEPARIAGFAGLAQLLEAGNVDAAMVVERRGAVDQLATFEARCRAEAQREHLVHEIPAHQPRRISHAIGVLSAWRIEQQADALDRGGTHHHDVRAHFMARAGGLVDVRDSGGPAGPRIGIDPLHRRVGSQR